MSPLLYYLSKSYFSEFGLSFISFIIMFISYFSVDLFYQNSICRNTDLKKIVYNSLENSFYVSSATFSGYISSLLFLKNAKFDIPNLNNVSSIHANLPSPFIINISNHKNNLILSIIFYLFTILYINPITFNKNISRNKIC